MDSENCPKCGNPKKQNDVECRNCGIIYKRYYAFLEKQQKPSNITKETQQKFNAIVKVALITMIAIVIICLYLWSQIENTVKHYSVYMALKNIEYATEEGVNFPDYFSFLNIAEEKITFIDSNSKRIKKLKNIFSLYDEVCFFWRAQIVLHYTNHKQTLSKEKAAYIISKTGYKYGYLKSYGGWPSRKEELLLADFSEQNKLKFYLWNKAFSQLQSYQEDQRWILNIIKILPILDSDRKVIEADSTSIYLE